MIKDFVVVGSIADGIVILIAGGVVGGFSSANAAPKFASDLQAQHGDHSETVDVWKSAHE
jgi:hypothetical protein